MPDEDLIERAHKFWMQHNQDETTAETMARFALLVAEDKEAQRERIAAVREFIEKVDKVLTENDDLHAWTAASDAFREMFPDSEL